MFLTWLWGYYFNSKHVPPTQLTSFREYITRAWCLFAMSSRNLPTNLLTSESDVSTGHIADCTYNRLIVNIGITFTFLQTANEPANSFSSPVRAEAVKLSQRRCISRRWHHGDATVQGLPENDPRRTVNTGGAPAFRFRRESLSRNGQVFFLFVDARWIWLPLEFVLNAKWRKSLRMLWGCRKRRHVPSLCFSKQNR